MSEVSKQAAGKQNLNQDPWPPKRWAQVDAILKTEVLAELADPVEVVVPR
ncbi:MAG TPA: hypothetical protein VGD78_06235 [Chthoniobacterales bacterium]